MTCLPSVNWEKCRRAKEVPDPICRDMGVSENRGPEYRTLNSRILIIRTPK